MEMEDQRDNSKKRTRKRKTSSLLSLNNTTTIFPLLLAAATQLSNSHKNTPNNSSEILVKKCLTKLHQSLLSNIHKFSHFCSLFVSHPRELQVCWNRASKCRDCWFGFSGVIGYE
ncbi:hypothetical protein OIU85_012206 [Salix viminalis]|uniref:Uncharacterized protein n=1 Tax=Salix viminalis TaxID=40686 RepID=A0A9Q0NNS6_SALVM|nr:hypothetical protein OIU85_012206 [Salix viminalis]